MQTLARRVAPCLLALCLLAPTDLGAQGTDNEFPADMDVAQIRVQAEGGYAPAMNELGNRLMSGQGVTADPREAFDWYRRGAEAGNTAAMRSLGMAYRRGVVTRRDPREANRWMELASETEARENRSRSEAEQAVREIERITQERAARLGPVIGPLTLRAEAGDTVAMRELGARYANGDDVAPDPTMALRWFSRGADAGSSEMMLILGVAYLYGRIGESEAPQELGEAARWFRAAADAGEADGAGYMGILYANGYGVTEDQRESFNWFLRAAEGGSVAGMYMAGIGYQTGRGVTANEEQGFGWLQRASEAGHVRAMYELATAYLNGSGVDEDRSQALLWARRAVAETDDDETRDAAQAMVERIEALRDR